MWQKVTLSWFMNSNMVKLEKFDHVQLVYHFKVPLNKIVSEGVYFFISTATLIHWKNHMMCDLSKCVIF